MEELVPLFFGIVVGAVIWRKTTGLARIGSGFLAVAIIAALATLSSGEFTESWAFLLLDAGLGALGVGIGSLLMHAWPRLVGKPDSWTDSAQRRQG